MVNGNDWRCYLLHQRDIVAMAVYSEFDNIYYFNRQLIGVINGKEYQILSIQPLKFTHKHTIRNRQTSIINKRTVYYGNFLTGTIYSIYINPELQWSRITQAEIDEIFDDIYEAHCPRSSADKDSRWMPLKWPRNCEYTIDGYRYVLDEPYGLLTSDFNHNYEFCALRFKAVDGSERRAENVPEGARGFPYLTLVGRSEAEILNRIDSIRLKGHLDVNISLEAYKEKLGPYEPRPHIVIIGALIYSVLMFAITMFEERVLGWGFLTFLFVLWLRSKPDFWLLWYDFFGKRIREDVNEEMPFEKPELFRREINPKEARKRAKENNDKQGY